MGPVFDFRLFILLTSFAAAYLLIISGYLKNDQNQRGVRGAGTVRPLPDRTAAAHMQVVLAMLRANGPNVEPRLRPNALGENMGRVANIDEFVDGLVTRRDTAVLDTK